MKMPVRATRGYLAGFGTSGSLLAGAALLFLLGSAIVAFRGWPQIATGPAITAVSAPAHAVRSPAGKLAALLTTRPHVRTDALGTLGRRERRTAGVRGERRGGVVGPTSRAPAATPGTGAGAGTGAGSPAAAASSAACGGAACNPASGPQSLITHTANTVAQEVSSIGSAAGSQAGGTTESVANDASGVSPPAGGAVQSAGQAVTGTSTGAANTTSTTISQVGGALGGGH